MVIIIAISNFLAKLLEAFADTLTTYGNDINEIR